MESLAIRSAFRSLFFNLTLLLVFAVSTSTSSSSSTTTRPKSIILELTRDPSTLQYTTFIQKQTPLAPIKVAVDLGGKSLWVNCSDGYISSSFKSVNCHSAHCALSGYTLCGDSSPYLGGNAHPSPLTCNKNACFSQAYYSDVNKTESVITTTTAEDVLTVRDAVTDQVVSAPRFVFACPMDPVSEILPRGAVGVVGLGTSLSALPTQLAQIFSFRRKFLVCLSPSAKANSSVVVLGDFPIKGDISKSLVYTPILKNPVTRGERTSEEISQYYVGLKSIKVNGKTAPINSQFLSFDDKGNGGTRISNLDAYSLMVSAIYQPLLEAFLKELPPSVKTVPPVEPFGACFQGSVGALSSQIPSIDFVFQNSKSTWRISGTNSMVQVKKDVMCFGFVEFNDVRSRSQAVTIGAHQLEDNLLVVDLQSSRVGFSPSLLSHKATCASFKSTVAAA